MNCPKCGNANAEGSTFCVSCGAPMGAAPVQATSQPSQAKPQAKASGGSSKTILIVALVAVVVVVVIAAVFLMGGGGGSGNVISCQVSGSATGQAGQASMSGTIVVKKPDKARMDVAVSGSGISMNMRFRVSGTTAYVNLGTLTQNKWVKADATGTSSLGQMDMQWSALMSMTPEQLAANIRSSISQGAGGSFTPTVTCGYSGDVPDSEFLLPPGEIAVDATSLSGT